jgi:hypothetical protein
MAIRFDEIPLFNGDEQDTSEVANPKQAFHLEWWHWSLISISFIIAIIGIIIIIYFFGFKRCIQRNNNPNLYQNTRYIEMNHIDNRPIVRQSKSSVSKFSNISDYNTVYGELTFTSLADYVDPTNAQ